MQKTHAVGKPKRNFASGGKHGIFGMSFSVPKGPLIPPTGMFMHASFYMIWLC